MNIVVLLVSMSLGASPNFSGDRDTGCRCGEAVFYYADDAVSQWLNPWAWLSANWRPEHLRVVPAIYPPKRIDLLDSARDHLGTPYVWGGTGRSGFDCSGFVNAVYAQHGYDLPRVSRDQFRIGVKTPKSKLKAGDLVFFVKEPGSTRISHVGMYVGDDEFIHAAAGKGEVSFDRLTSRYYRTRFAGGRRMLSLPPGRYSTTSGRAAARLLFASAHDAKDARPLSADPILEQLGLTRSGDTPREHAPDDRPLQFSSGFVKGAITQVGPRMLLTDETAIGLRLGVGRMDDAEVMLLVPEFQYFGHGNSLRISVGAPLLVPLIGEEASFSDTLVDGWDELQDYSKLIREVRFGQKESNLYFELSRTGSGSLGHGQIMRFYTPNVASQYLPEYLLNPDALSASFDAYADFGGFEIFVDDVLKPHVMGLLVFGKPGFIIDSKNSKERRLSVGLTYGVDRDAPLSLNDDGSWSEQVLHAVGLDAEYKYYKSGWLDLKAYVDVSSLVYDGGGGVGGAVGTLLRANLSGRRHHIFRARIEGRLSGASFIPSYFDASYALDRLRAPVRDQNLVRPLTKLALLAELKGTANRWGLYGEFVYHYRRKLSVALSYEDGDSFGELPASETYLGRNLMATVQVRDFYIPGSSKAVSFYFAYHLRNFEWDLSTLNDSHQYLFVTGSWKLSRYAELNVSLRKSVDGWRDTDASIDAVVGIKGQLEI